MNENYMNNEKRVHSSIYDEKCYAMRYYFFFIH